MDLRSDARPTCAEPLKIITCILYGNRFVADYSVCLDNCEKGGGTEEGCGGMGNLGWVVSP